MVKAPDLKSDQILLVIDLAQDKKLHNVLIEGLKYLLNALQDPGIAATVRLETLNVIK